MGISAGDTVVYSYQILSLVAGTNMFVGVDHIIFTVAIDYVNASAPLGDVIYTEAVNTVNATTETTLAPVTNETAIFDPYDNYTYLGNIGFYPFTYTNLLPGSASLSLKLFVSGVPGYSGRAPGGTVHINATVARTPGSIDINYTFPIPNGLPVTSAMVFNATTGLLEKGVWNETFSGETKIFTYTLVSLSHPKAANPADLTFLWYVALAFIVVIVGYEVATRGTRRERKAARMRKKLEIP